MVPRGYGGIQRTYSDKGEGRQIGPILARIPHSVWCSQPYPQPYLLHCCLFKEICFYVYQEHVTYGTVINYLVFSVFHRTVCIYQFYRVIAFILVFVELPLCMRFCPTSQSFDTFISRFENAYVRAAGYLVFSVVMFLSNLINTSTLIVAAVTLLIAAIFYGIAAIKDQPHVSSKWTGGSGLDNVV
ncbi:hypothetical protein BC937DRAFT_90992 [Endogone sp. FLAS-F59071]|nr:hypothetical protein BC937DRAFT_90992 [Endogone sp. FLAS-F59071]|eukprot:RUS16618.1 hypothetical protein BC937DRAFT_90992 [Endogone sp. FLAS-F59071]